MRATTKIEVGQVTLPAISGPAVQIVAARPGRTKLSIQHAAQIYIGPDSSVTGSTGFLLNPRSDGGPSEVETQAAVFGVSTNTTGGVLITSLETSD